MIPTSSYLDNLRRRQAVNKRLGKKVGESLSKIIVGSAVLRAGGFVSLGEAIKSRFFFANLGRGGTVGSVAIGTVAKSITVTLSFGLGFYAGDYLGAYLDTVADNGGFGSSTLQALYFGSGQPSGEVNSCSL